MNPTWFLKRLGRSLAGALAAGIFFLAAAAHAQIVIDIDIDTPVDVPGQPGSTVQATADASIDPTATPDGTAEATATNINQVTTGQGGALGIVSAASGTTAQAAALNVLAASICIDIGAFGGDLGLCEALLNPPGGGGGGGGRRNGGVGAVFGGLSDADVEGLVFPNIVFDNNLRAILAADGLTAALSQRFLAVQAMSVGISDLNARLFRLRSGFDDILLAPYEVPGGGGAKNPKAPVIVDPEPWGWEFFAQGNLGDLDIDDFPVAGNLNSNAYSGTLGVERQFNENLQLGFAGTWVEVDGELDGNFGTTDVSGVLVSAYASYQRGNFYVDGLYSYGFLDHRLGRTALGVASARADFESNNQIIQLNTGLNYPLGKFQAGPYLSLQYNRGDIDGYGESGAALLNLDVDGQEYESLTSELGWQISREFKTGDRAVVGQLRAGWVHEYLDDQEAVTGALRAFPGNRLSALSPSFASDYGLVGVGVLAQLGENTSLGADYQIRIADDVTEQVAGVTLTFRF